MKLLKFTAVFALSTLAALAVMAWLPGTTGLIAAGLAVLGIWWSLFGFIEQLISSKALRGKGDSGGEGECVVLTAPLPRTDFTGDSAIVTVMGEESRTRDVSGAPPLHPVDSILTRDGETGAVATLMLSPQPTRPSRPCEKHERTMPDCPDCRFSDEPGQSELEAHGFTIVR